MQRERLTLAAAAVAAITLWPLIHIFLVGQYDLSPWKLGGWGMYSAPRTHGLNMELMVKTSGAIDFAPLEHPTELVQTEAREFLSSYLWLRGLADAEAFAELVLSEHSQYSAVRLTFERPRLDRESGMIVSHRTEYIHP